MTYTAQNGPSPSGYFEENLINMGRFLMAHGYTRIGAAGIAGCVAGESMGDPEDLEGGGSGGGGLIQWTPIDAYPGLVTGNPTVDLNNQFAAIPVFNNNTGSSVAALNAQPDPVSAARYYSENFEHPHSTDSDVRATMATLVYNALGGPPPPPRTPWPLREGAYGPYVKTLQDRLNKWGFAHPFLVDDGSFGPLTKAAVQKALEHWHYKASSVTEGVVDGSLWNHLETAPPAPGTFPAPTNPSAIGGHTTVDLAWRAVYSMIADHPVTGYQVVIYNDPPVILLGHWQVVTKFTVPPSPSPSSEAHSLQQGKGYQAHIWALGSPNSSEKNYASVRFRTA